MCGSDPAGLNESYKETEACSKIPTRTTNTCRENSWMEMELGRTTKGGGGGRGAKMDNWIQAAKLNPRNCQTAFWVANKYGEIWKVDKGGYRQAAEYRFRIHQQNQQRSDSKTAA
jgi:hypothetical protein